jgi:hypothetical protein
MKAALRWVYDWITVLTASLVGLPSLLLEFLSYFDGVDISPFIGYDKASKIVTGVALAKALLAFIESRIKEQG